MTENQRGFFLVEVLVAIVIISVAMVAALAGMSRALKMSERSEAFTQTVLPMEELLFEIETGSRQDLLEAGGKAQFNDKTFQVQSRLAFDAKTEKEKKDQPPHTPFYRLEVNSSDEGSADFWKADMVMGQELFV